MCSGMKDETQILAKNGRIERKKERKKCYSDEA
jgi:hypothetical protein